MICQTIELIIKHMADAVIEDRQSIKKEEQKKSQSVKESRRAS